MSGRILIVESGTSQRILLRAVLSAAHFDPVLCDSALEARAAMEAGPTGLLLVDGTSPAAIALVEALRASPDTTELPIIALCPRSHVADRIAALRAGADDVLDRAIDGAVLLARIRSLLRAHVAQAELGLHGAARHALGLAEGGMAFVPAGRVAVICQPNRPLPDKLAALIDRLPGGATILSADQDLSVDKIAGGSPDLYLIDGVTGSTSGSVSGGGSRSGAAEALRLVSDLRSRPGSRHAATLIYLPQGQPEIAAMAYDLGADDLADTATSTEELAHRVRALLRRKSLADRRRDSVQIGLQAAVTDPLTGLHNRRYALPELTLMAEATRAGGRGFAVMMLDLDHFKAINDSHGHAAGDRVLVEVARRLRSNLRAVDLIARIGGEEFLVAMPDTSAEQATGAAERLRRVIDGTPFEIDAGQPARRGALRLKVTMSIGVTVCRPEDPADGAVERLFARADSALYAAKSAGRNMVTMARTAA